MAKTDTKTEGETTEAAPKKPAKGALPEGLMRPVEFAKTIDCRPQIIYGYIRNSKTFPFVEGVKDENGNTVAFAVKVEEANAWLKEKDERKATREAAKAEKAEAAAKA